MKRFFSKGLSINVFALGAVSLLTDISREMIFPLLPLYLTTVLGASTSFVGLVEGIAESTSSVLKIVSGWLSDKIQRRKTLMQWGYGLSAFTRPLIALATSGWHILVVRFVEKVGKGIRVPPRDALIAESCASETRGKAFGIHRTMDNIGSILGPLLAFSLLTVLDNNYRQLFWFASIPAFFAIAILTLFVSEKSRDIPSHEISATANRLKLSQFSRKFKLFLVTTIVFELADSSNAFLLLRVKDLGVSLELIPIIYLVSNLFNTIGSLPGGMLSDKFGRRNVLAIGWFIYGLSYLGFAFATSVTQAWILFCVYGLFSGLTGPAKKALVADLVPKEIRGSAYGIYNFALGIPKLPASLILGILWQEFSAALAFSTGAGLAIAACCLLLLFIPSKVNPSKI